MKLLLDTVILIDHFNDIKKATEFITLNQKNISISIITRAELLTGFNSKRNLNLAKQLCDEFEQHPLTVAEADLAASLRQKYGWKLSDAFQAAIAKNHKLKLVTRNTKDFNPNKHPFVLIPYQL